MKAVPKTLKRGLLRNRAGLREFDGLKSRPMAVVEDECLRALERRSLDRSSKTSPAWVDQGSEKTLVRLRKAAASFRCWSCTPSTVARLRLRQVAAGRKCRGSYGGCWAGPRYRRSWINLFLPAETSRQTVECQVDHPWGREKMRAMWEEQGDLLICDPDRVVTRCRRVDGRELQRAHSSRAWN